MKTITMDGVTLGAGLPKIIVPLVGKTDDELMQEAELIAKLDCDIIEWRLDYYEKICDFKAAVQLSKQLKSILHKPFLITFRTKKEGGERALSDEMYFQLYHTFLLEGTFDLLDIELFMPADIVEKLTSLAHQQGKKVIMSSHDFTKTPPKAEIINRLKKMQALEADICKIAVMPQTAADVLTLLEATEEMFTTYADRPLITMSMGSLGAISRVAGGTFGSCATFGAAAIASAPGQLAVAELRGILKALEV